MSVKLLVDDEVRLKKIYTNSQDATRLIHRDCSQAPSTYIASTDSDVSCSKGLLT